MSTKQRLALLVLGMHRSGTSAFAGLLGLCGASMPQNLIPANPRNPKGFFESEPLYLLHDELFAAANTSWQDLSPFPSRFMQSREAAAWETRVRETVVSEFGDSPFFALKDPRLCRLVPLWQRVLASMSVEPRYLLVVRDPLEIARSLHDSAGVPEASGLLLWLEYFLACERDTRGHPRSFVSYDDLLANWRAVLSRVEQDLAVGFPRHSRRSDAEIDAFLSRAHRHHVTHADEIFQREEVNPWVKQAYRWALSATAGESPDAGTLDAIRADFLQAEDAFGPALAASAVQRREHEDLASQRGNEIEVLEGQLEAQRDEIRALRAKLTQRREQAEAFTATARVLMRWVVDRARSPDEPVPPALKAAIDAIAKAEPAEIPGIASTALLLSEQTLAIRELSDERMRRAQTLEELASKLAESGSRLDQQAESLETLRQALSRADNQVVKARAELVAAKQGEREQRAAALVATRERERLTQECARLLRKRDES